MVFQNKGNACILIHPISNYNFLGESFKNSLFSLYYIFTLSAEIFPPGTWVETIDSTLDTLVQ